MEEYGRFERGKRRKRTLLKPESGPQLPGGAQGPNVDDRLAGLSSHSFFQLADAAFSRGCGADVVAAQRLSSMQSFTGDILLGTETVISLRSGRTSGTRGKTAIANGTEDRQVETTTVPFRWRASGMICI